MKVTLVQSILFRLLPDALAAKCSAEQRSPHRALPGGRRMVQLRRDELIRLTKVSGVGCIEVRQGLIWLTGTPATGDVLVCCGDRFELTNQWPFVIQALQNAELLLAG